MSYQGHVVLSGWWEIWQPRGRLPQHGCWQLASSCPVCQTDWLSVALLGRDPAMPAPTPGRAPWTALLGSESWLEGPEDGVLAEASCSVPGSTASV